MERLQMKQDDMTLHLARVAEYEGNLTIPAYNVLISFPTKETRISSGGASGNGILAARKTSDLIY